MYLLDTSIVSEYAKRRPSRSAIDWLDSKSEHLLFISVLTAAELQKGLCKLEAKPREFAATARSQQLNSWIASVKASFNGRILALDAPVLRVWAELSGRAEAFGNSLPVVDCMLAATALVHNLCIVTANVRDFEKCSGNLGIYNPLAT